MLTCRRIGKQRGGLSSFFLISFLFASPIESETTIKLDPRRTSSSQSGRRSHPGRLYISSPFAAGSLPEQRMALSPGDRGDRPGGLTPPGSTVNLAEQGRDRGQYEHMESWLDTHPEFAHDYFARKATRSMIDGWYIARAVSQSAKPPVAESPHSPSSSSGSNTPVRKVSASEFEVQGTGGSLGRMVQTVDGSPCFLGPSHLISLEKHGKSSPTHPRKAVIDIKSVGVSGDGRMDDRGLLMELVKDIANDLELNSLCHKILQNVLLLTKADRGSLFLVHGKGTDNCYLASKLFDVTSYSTAETSGKEVRVAWGKGIVGYVAKTGETVNIANAYEVSI